MKIAVLTANLNNFDTPVDIVQQDIPCTFHRFTDANFPPITGLTPRLQYRIPKLFGWQMLPDYDVYIWFDSSMSLQRPDSVTWLLAKLGAADMAFFKHPWRNTIKEEVDHIEEKLKLGNKYITSRYKNGLHKEQYEIIKKHPVYEDNVLYASTAFIYRNNVSVRRGLELWWAYQSRYFTVDQIALPFAVRGNGIQVNKIDEDIFNNPYISLVSKHK